MDINSIKNKPYSMWTKRELEIYMDTILPEIKGKKFSLYISPAYGDGGGIVTDEDMFIYFNEQCTSLNIGYMYWSSISIEYEAGLEEDVSNDEIADMINNGNYEDYRYIEMKSIDGSVIDGATIVGYEIVPFNEEYELYLDSTECRVAGGDYFMNFRLILDNGYAIDICGQDSTIDGYMSVRLNKK